MYKWRFPKIGVPQNGWFILENPIKMDDLGENPLFSETPKWRFGLEECPFVFWPPAVCSKHCVAPMLRQNFALCFGFVFVSRDSVWTSRLDNSVGHLRLCGFFLACQCWVLSRLIGQPLLRCVTEVCQLDLILESRTAGYGSGFDSAWNVEQHLPKIRKFLERGR